MQLSELTCICYFVVKRKGNHEDICFFVFYFLWQNRDILNLGFRRSGGGGHVWEDPFNLSSMNFFK